VFSRLLEANLGVGNEIPAARNHAAAVTYRKRTR
jgi:hypothetical protein